MGSLLRKYFISLKSIFNPINFYRAIYYEYVKKEGNTVKYLVSALIYNTAYSLPFSIASASLAYLDDSLKFLPIYIAAFITFSFTAIAGYYKKSLDTLYEGIRINRLRKGRSLEQKLR